jgi:hypothetical protein
MKRSHVTLTSLLLMTALALTACDTADDPTNPADDGARLSVYLTDAPGEVASVWVEIEDVSLRGDGQPVVLLSEPTGLIQITELVDRTQEIVDDFIVPPGRYGQLRLRIEDAVLETTDGDVYVLEGAEHPDQLPATGALMCPSCSQSGLKVILHGMEVVEGDNSLVLDFDVSQSFGHQAGKSGKWIMRPVIHSSFIPTDDDNLEETGLSVEGEVVLDTGVEIPACPANAPRGIEDFLPTAIAQNLVDDEGFPVVRTGRVDDDGEFEIEYLASDTYVLAYEESIEYGQWTLVFEATVVPSEAVTLDEEDLEGVVYTITNATCNQVSGN